ncbi:MAG: hypothetical protein WBG48_06285 [Pricia sp.]
MRQKYAKNLLLALPYRIVRYPHVWFRRGLFSARKAPNRTGIRNVDLKSDVAKDGHKHSGERPSKDREVITGEVPEKRSRPARGSWPLPET